MYMTQSFDNYRIQLFYRNIVVSTHYSLIMFYRLK